MISRYIKRRFSIFKGLLLLFCIILVSVLFGAILSTATGGLIAKIIGWIFTLEIVVLPVAFAEPFVFDRIISSFRIDGDQRRNRPASFMNLQYDRVGWRAFSDGELVKIDVILGVEIPWTAE